MSLMPQIIQEIAEAGKTLAVMCAHGVFSSLGALFSYFYHVDRRDIQMRFRQLLLWVGMGFGVGMAAGQFIPTSMAAEGYGLLWIAGAFWRQTWDALREKAKLLKNTGG